MTDASEPSLREYFDEAASWDADRAAQAQRNARVAWFVAGVAWLCAIASSAAIAFLTPLKTVAPFVIRVDNTSGLVDVVPVYAGSAKIPETLTRYLLQHYISVCERFNFATAESDYEECGAFHSAHRNQEWSAQWAKANPESPLNRYKDGTTVQAHVTSISFFQKANGVADLAQVRYVRGTRTGEGGEERLTHWIATIQYAYVEPSKDSKLRQWNPLGFRVVDFRPEAETLAPVIPTSGGPSGAAQEASTGVTPGATQ